AMRRSSWSERGRAAARWTAQIGIAATLAAMLVGGFFGLAMLTEAGRKFVAHRESASAQSPTSVTVVRSAVEAPPQVTPAAGVASISDGAAIDESGAPVASGIAQALEDDASLHEAAASFREEYAAPGPLLHYDKQRYRGETFTAHGRYTLTIPVDFDGPQAIVSPAGERNWSIVYLWESSQFAGAEIRLTISRSDAFRDRPYPTIHTRNPLTADYSRALDRVGLDYFVLNGRTSLLETDELTAARASYHHGETHGLLWVMHDDDRRIEYHARCPAAVSHRVFPVLLAVSSTIAKPTELSAYVPPPSP
ncbi:MAG: hypothetical protein KDA41_03560, partial [Planctomycetales bacterium]|nr:hypothetical protein [Planctomycetales bacterium]